MSIKIPGVGYSTPRFDARAKVTGEEKYAADHSLEDVLWAGAKRAGIAHGIIRSIDASAAREVSGVHAILTRKDITGTNRQGIVLKDQPVLAGGKVRHCGDPVALVLAKDRDVLKKALGLIRVDFEPLPGVFDSENALKPEAPRVHESGNILKKAVISTGNALESFDECDIVVEDSFEVSGQEHAFLETENGLAWREPDGRIVMIVSTQAPFRDRFEIAHALGIEVEEIRVISPYLGGGFGGKDGVYGAMPAGACRPARRGQAREDVVGARGEFRSGLQAPSRQDAVPAGSDAGRHAARASMQPLLRYGTLRAPWRGGHGARHGARGRAIPHPEYVDRGMVRLHQ